MSLLISVDYYRIHLSIRNLLRIYT